MPRPAAARTADARLRRRNRAPARSRATEARASRSSAAAVRAAASSAVLPIPAGPSITTNVPRPERASASADSIRASSSLRSRSVAAARAGRACASDAASAVNVSPIRSATTTERDRVPKADIRSVTACVRARGTHGRKDRGVATVRTRVRRLHASPRQHHRRGGAADEHNLGLRARRRPGRRGLRIRPRPAGRGLRRGPCRAQRPHRPQARSDRPLPDDERRRRGARVRAPGRARGLGPRRRPQRRRPRRDRRRRDDRPRRDEGDRDRSRPGNRHGRGRRDLGAS